MADNSKIEWCHATFNPWRGCTKVSQGCKNCSAETLSARNPAVLGVWGPGGGRPVAAESYWREPLKWDRAARASGERRRVFCASLADVFERLPDSHPDAAAVRRAQIRFYDLIYATPHLDWLLLTKRPENLQEMLPPSWYQKGNGGSGFPTNVWLGVSVEDQAAADKRLVHLLRTPAAVRFMSYEPALGPVDLDLSYPCPSCDARGGGRESHSTSLDDGVWDCVRCEGTGRVPFGNLDWVIVGGESGPGARPFDIAWARQTVAQCREAGVACFVKQMGSVPVMDEGQWRAMNPSPMLSLGNDGRAPAGTVPLLFRDRKGGDVAEWPEDLRVREFPQAREVGG